MTRLQIEQEWRVKIHRYGCECRGPSKNLDQLGLDSKLLHTIGKWDSSAQKVIRRYGALIEELRSYSNRILLAAFLDQDDADTAKPLRSMRAVERKALSEHLIEVSRSDAPSPIEDQVWQDRIKGLADGSEEPVTADELLKRFGTETKTEKLTQFHAGLRALAASWPALDLNWNDEARR